MGLSAGPPAILQEDHAACEATLIHRVEIHRHGVRLKRSPPPPAGAQGRESGQEAVPAATRIPRDQRRHRDRLRPQLERPASRRRLHQARGLPYGRPPRHDLLREPPPSPHPTPPWRRRVRHMRRHELGSSRSRRAPRPEPVRSPVAGGRPPGAPLRRGEARAARSRLPTSRAVDDQRLEACHLDAQ